MVSPIFLTYYLGPNYVACLADVKHRVNITQLHVRDMQYSDESAGNLVITNFKNANVRSFVLGTCDLPYNRASRKRHRCAMSQLMNCNALVCEVDQNAPYDFRVDHSVSHKGSSVWNEFFNHSKPLSGHNKLTSLLFIGL